MNHSSLLDKKRTFLYKQNTIKSYDLHLKRGRDMKKNKKNIKKRIEQKRSRHILKRKKRQQNSIHIQKQKDAVKEIKTDPFDKYTVSFEDFTQKFVMTIEGAKKHGFPINLKELYKNYVENLEIADYCYVNLKNINEVDAFNAEVNDRAYEFIRHSRHNGVSDKEKESKAFSAYMNKVAKEIKKRNLKAMYDKLYEEARQDAQK